MRAHEPWQQVSQNWVGQQVLAQAAIGRVVRRSARGARDHQPLQHGKLLVGRTGQVGGEHRAVLPLVL